MQKHHAFFGFILVLTHFFAFAGNVLKGEKLITFESSIGQNVEAYEGTFMVPENRSVADGKQIPITYVRFISTSEQPGAPIVYLAGGPGGSGINTAKYRRFPLFMALREFGDVIALDQRGAGLSDTTPECQSSHTIQSDQLLTDQQYVALHQKALKECLGFWQKKGVDVFGYTTEESVVDLDALRKHLGVEKISLWGISYGSHLALAALKVMGDRLEKVIIASAEGLSQTIKMPGRTDAYFDRLQAAVNTQSVAQKNFGDIKSLMRRVHKKLEAQPLSVSVPQKNGGNAEFLVQRKDLQMLASSMIADPSSVKWLLQVYAALDNDIVEPLKFILQKYYQAESTISFKVMSTAMDLASGMSQTKRATIQTQAETALLRDYLNFSYHLTDVLPAIDLGDEFRKKPISAVPTLLFSGTLDGRTYIESQREAVAGLSTLTAITVHNAGHNLFMASPEKTQPDVEKIIKQFMRNEKVTTNEITVNVPSFFGF